MKWPKLTTSSTKKETRAGDELRIDYTTEQNNDSKKGENKIRDEQLTPLKNIQNPAEWLLLQHSRLTHVPDQQIARPSTPYPLATATAPTQPPPSTPPPTSAPSHPPQPPPQEQTGAAPSGASIRPRRGGGTPNQAPNSATRGSEEGGN